MNNDQPKVKSRFQVGVHPVFGGPSFDHPPTVEIVERVAEMPLEDLTTKLGDDDFELMAQGEPPAKRQKPGVPLEDLTTKVNDEDFELMAQGETDAKPDVSLEDEPAIVNDNNFEATKEKDGYSCNYCLKVMKGKTHMRRHIRIHTGEKLFQCSICGKSFSQKVALQSHMRSIHNFYSK